MNDKYTHPAMDHHGKECLLPCYMSLAASSLLEREAAKTANLSRASRASLWEHGHAEMCD